MRGDGHGALPSVLAGAAVPPGGYRLRREELARLLAAGGLTGQALRAGPMGLGQDAAWL
jgi:hypothetical protein